MAATHQRKQKKERVTFGYEGCYVVGYPSSGGILTKGSIDVVEALFLGINCFQSFPPTSDPAEEDDFCDKLRCIGAKWWRYPQDEPRVIIGDKVPTKEQEAITIFGWPQQGGVFLLRYENESALPEDFGRIHMAINMGERCEIMKEYGARFFADPKEVKELAEIAGLKVAENAEKETAATLS